MTGNVFEWVADWYDPNYYSNSPVENPLGPQNGDDKVLRGSSWGDGVDNARVGLLPDTQKVVIGFRCAAAAPE